MQPTEQKTEQTTQEACGGNVQPQKEHNWLQQLVGEWTCEGEAIPGPGQPSITWKAKESVRSIGGVWVVGEGVGDTPGGGTSHSLITLGLDPQSGHYTGTFVGSMMTYLWVYEGEMDAAERVLTLKAAGPGMSPATPKANYRDVIEIHSPDVRTMTSFIEGEGGQWTQVMKITYRRQ